MSSADPTRTVHVSVSKAFGARVKAVEELLVGIREDFASMKAWLAERPLVQGATQGEIDEIRAGLRELRSVLSERLRGPVHAYKVADPREVVAPESIEAPVDQAACAPPEEESRRRRLDHLLDRWAEALDRFEREIVRPPADLHPDALWPPRPYQGTTPRLRAELVLREAFRDARVSLGAVLHERIRSAQAPPPAGADAPGPALADREEGRR